MYYEIVYRADIFFWMQKFIVVHERKEHNLNNSSKSYQ